MWKLVILGAFACVVVALNQYRRHKALKADAAGGCVACGDSAVETVGDRLRCSACGYEGAADRGGTLSAQDLQSTAITTRFDDPR